MVLVSNKNLKKKISKHVHGVKFCASKTVKTTFLFDHAYVRPIGDSAQALNRGLKYIDMIGQVGETNPTSCVCFVLLCRLVKARNSCLHRVPGKSHPVSRFLCLFEANPPFPPLEHFLTQYLVSVVYGSLRRSYE